MFRSRNEAAAVIVAALGYFVDIYDLVLFSVVRKASLESIGVTGDELLSTGIYLLNVQMVGLLLGGILWGVWGDKKGRISVLFGSIALYSLANLANGFVGSVESYAACRFFAGIGLAGELGAGITLVSELLTKEFRGYGTTIIATVGVSGAVAAGLVSDLFPWQTAYFVGGGLGLALLLLRMAVSESGMFESLLEKQVRRGDLILLVTSPSRLAKYAACILCGVPIWYAIGILITFSPEMGKAMDMFIVPTAGRAVLYCYAGLVVGDLTSGLLSQWAKSRKLVIIFFLALCCGTFYTYLLAHQPSLFEFYCMCTAIGFSGGYWALFVSSAAEQFGTNLRSTVTTTVPNFVRGSVVPITLTFDWLKGRVGILDAASYVGAICLILAVLATYRLHESFGKDLDYLEQ